MNNQGKKRKPEEQNRIQLFSVLKSSLPSEILQRRQGSKLNRTQVTDRNIHKAKQTSPDRFMK